MSERLLFPELLGMLEGARHWRDVVKAENAIKERKPELSGRDLDELRAAWRAKKKQLEAEAMTPKGIERFFGPDT